MRSKLITLLEQIRDGEAPNSDEIKALLEALNGPREFHAKHLFPLDWPTPVKAADEKFFELFRIERDVGELAGKSMRPEDLELYRLHLILEETAELAQALRMGWRTKIADAVADLLYVVIGTAESYGLPWVELLEEVHRSNMSKKVRSNDDLRMRDKGPDYRPPDVGGVLERYASHVDDRIGGGDR